MKGLCSKVPCKWADLVITWWVNPNPQVSLPPVCVLGHRVTQTKLVRYIVSKADSNIGLVCADDF